jgi:hypothetical protein
VAIPIASPELEDSAVSTASAMVTTPALPLGLAAWPADERAMNDPLDGA